VFIDRFNALAKNPNRNKQHVTCTTEMQNAIDTSERLYKVAEKIVASRLPNLDNIHPEKGNERKNPSGRATRIIPSSETFTFNAA